MRFSFILLFFCFIFLTNYSQAIAVDVQYRQKLIYNLKQAIRINEDFKESIFTEQSNHDHVTRQQLENYHEEKLMTLINDAVAFIAKEKDMELLDLFLDMEISYENSADEELANVCGELFIKVPDLVFDVFKELNKEDRKWIYGQIEFGYGNTQSDYNFSESEIEKVYNDLKKLKKMIE